MTGADLTALLSVLLGAPAALALVWGGFRRWNRRRDVEIIAREDARREQREVHAAVLGSPTSMGLVAKVTTLKEQVATLADHTNGNLTSRLDRIEGLSTTVLANQEERALVDRDWRGVIESRLGNVEDRLHVVEDRDRE